MWLVQRPEDPDSDPSDRGMDSRIRIRTKMAWIRNTVSRSLSLKWIKILEKTEKKRYSRIDLLVQRAEEFVASARTVAHLGTWARRPVHGRVVAAKFSRNRNLAFCKCLTRELTKCCPSRKLNLAKLFFREVNIQILRSNFFKCKLLQNFVSANCRKLEKFCEILLYMHIFKQVLEPNLFATLQLHHERWRLSPDCLNLISRPLKPMDDAAAKRRTIGGATDGAASFTSKLSLLLIFPLIESQTR